MSGGELTVLSLFAGIGGFDLGLERAGMKVVAQCEIDPFCRRILKKHWPDVPCFDDIRELRGEDVGPVDVIAGGYPCQPFSAAGKRRGAEDDRHLWPEMFRLVRELRPAWVIGENVAGHVSMGLDDVLSDLEGEGYTARPFVIPACAVDAPHRRDRVWTVAHASITGREGRTPAGHNGSNGAEPGDKQPSGCGGIPWRAWPSESGIRRVSNGIPKRVDRLRALGNAVVPQVVEQIGRAVISSHYQHGGTP